MKTLRQLVNEYAPNGYIIADRDNGAEPDKDGQYIAGDVPENLYGVRNA